MNKQLLITAVIALIVGGAAGYLAPHSLAKTAGATGSFSRMAGVGSFMRGGGMGSGALSGTVAAKDASSITIDTRDGSSHVVLISPATTVAKNVAGTLADVSVGSTILVSGTANKDGSVSASSIQLRPADTAQPTK
jgi:hypothetical protein